MQCPRCGSVLYFVANKGWMWLECKAWVCDGVDIEYQETVKRNSRPCGWCSNRCEMLATEKGYFDEILTKVILKGGS